MSLLNNNRIHNENINTYTSHSKKHFACPCPVEPSNDAELMTARKSKRGKGQGVGVKGLGRRVLRLTLVRG